MESNKKVKKGNVIAMSKATKRTLSQIAHEIKGQNLFIDKIEIAKKTLQNLKSLPI